MSAIVIDKPNGISLFRLLSIRGRIKLEAMGLKGRGASTKSLVAAEFGLKPRDKPEKFLAAIDTKIAEVKAAGDLGISGG